MESLKIIQCYDKEEGTKRKILPNLTAVTTQVMRLNQKYLIKLYRTRKPTDGTKIGNPYWFDRQQREAAWRKDGFGLDTTIHYTLNVLKAVLNERTITMGIPSLIIQKLAACYFNAINRAERQRKIPEQLERTEKNIPR